MVMVRVGGSINYIMRMVWLWGILDSVLGYVNVKILWRLLIKLMEVVDGME
jgi:hypothetical protein